MKSNVSASLHLVLVTLHWCSTIRLCKTNTIIFSAGTNTVRFRNTATDNREIPEHDNILTVDCADRQIKRRKDER
jgi:hypothetical protein